MNFLNNMDEKQKKYFTIAVFLLLGLLSMTLAARVFTSFAATGSTVAYLDEKKKTVLELTAAATTSSAAITMIPGDIGTPIADKLADLSGYTLIVLVAVFLEKYLVTITGSLVFRFLLLDFPGGVCNTGRGVAALWFAQNLVLRNGGQLFPYQGSITLPCYHPKVFRLT